MNNDETHMLLKEMISKFSLPMIDIKGIDYLSKLTLKINNSNLKNKIFQKYKENEIEICGTKIDLI